MDMAAGYLAIWLPANGKISKKPPKCQSKWSISQVIWPSFKNIDIAQTNTALTAVFTGETESLKRLGIVMTETNLEAFALSRGIQGKQ